MRLRYPASSAVAALFLAVVSAAAPARAQTPSETAVCIGGAPATSIANWEAACNSVIATPGLPSVTVATAYYRLGNIYLGLRDYDRAVDDYDRALALLPGDPLLLNNRCWARALANRDLDAALADCNQVVQRQPGSAVAHNSRAFVLLRLGRYVEAINDYDSSLRINGRPNAVKASALFGRGVAEARTGDTKGADTDIQLAQSISPKIVEVFASFGVRP